MEKLLEKTKDLLVGKQTPITKENVSMLATTGKICTVEERVHEFIKEINELVLTKARLSQFVCLVEVPKELFSQVSVIEKDFADRGFSIHKLDPIIEGIFVINWSI